jgi:hypothetical protein
LFLSKEKVAGTLRHMPVQINAAAHSIRHRHAYGSGGIVHHPGSQESCHIAMATITIRPGTAP